MNRPPDLHRITPIGESALLLVLSEEISLAVNDRVQTLDASLRACPLDGILEWVPGYASLLVVYDPAALDYRAVKSHVLSCLNVSTLQKPPTPKQITIQVRYGGEGGPDLEAVADYHGLSPSELVRLHTNPTYQVGMMGFTPGFAYLLGLAPKLATPRRRVPRVQVPPGSVGIAGSQTGIYPLESPGGWQLIGRTAEILYDPDAENPFLLSPGDAVRFHPLAEGVLP